MKELIYEWSKLITAVYPPDVTHLTLKVGTEETTFWMLPKMQNLITLEVLTLSDGYEQVGKNGLYDASMPLISQDKFPDTPHLRELRLPASVYVIEPGFLADLGARVLAAPDSPYYYNTPDGALYDHRTDTLVHLPDGEHFTLAPQVRLAPSPNAEKQYCLLAEQTTLVALRGAVTRGLRCLDIPRQSPLAEHWLIEDGVLYDRVMGQALLCLDRERKSYIAPAWCTSIAGNAFADCPNLENVTLTAPGIRVYPTAFASCPTLRQLDAPQDTHMLAGKNYPLIQVHTDLHTINQHALADVKQLFDKMYDPEASEAQKPPIPRLKIPYKYKPDREMQRCCVTEESYANGKFPCIKTTPVPEHPELLACFQAPPIPAPAPAEPQAKTQPAAKDEKMAAVRGGVQLLQKKIVEAAKKAASDTANDPTKIQENQTETDTRCVTIADKIESIAGEYIDCPELEEVSLPGSLQNITNSFRCCPKLKHITFRQGKNPVRLSIQDSFTECESLQEVVLPDCALLLQKSFQYCDSLESAVLPHSVAKLENSFNNCPSLRKIVFAPSGKGNANALTVMRSSFCKTALREVALPDRLRAMQKCFCDCPDLEKVHPNFSLRQMQECFNRTGLRQLPILRMLAKMTECYNNCPNLENVQLKQNVALYNGCFNNCSNLRTLELAQGSGFTMVSEEEKNEMSGLESLHLHCCKYLKLINQPHLREIRIDELDSFGPNSIDIENCPNLEKLEILAYTPYSINYRTLSLGEVGSLLKNDLPALKTLTLPRCMEVYKDDFAIRGVQELQFSDAKPAPADIRKPRILPDIERIRKNAFRPMRCPESLNLTPEEQRAIMQGNDISPEKQ